MGDIDLTFVDRIVAEIGPSRRNTIPLLQAIQKHFRYLPAPALERLSAISEVTPAAIAGVSTFYTQFRHKPVGKHIISVCHGTACHVKGAGLVGDAFRRHLGLADQQDTDADGLFTMEKVACLGCCTLAPVVQIDSVVYGHLTPDKIAVVIRDFLDLQNQAPAGAQAQAPALVGAAAGEIRVGLGSCCVAKGSQRIQQALEQAVARCGQQVSIKRVGCVGMCHQTPLVEVVNDTGKSYFYAKVTDEDARHIVLRHFKPHGLLRRAKHMVSRGLEHLLTDEAWESVERYTIEVRDPPVEAFLGPQRHLSTEHCGNIDPLSLDEYLSKDGFAGLRKALDMPRADVVKQVLDSGLRGRGGAGFPSGRKWELVAAAQTPVKYVVCNGDEGDPGAFMDRMILESYPHRVIEGMAIAAYAVGATEGVMYIRAEYPLAVQRTRTALEDCRKRGLLGDNVMGKGLRLDLQIMEGAGAFVCGEETAMLESIEGRRGMPRFRPPFPAESGLFGKPTLINNVETYSLVPWVMRHGAAALSALGTGKSKGTKVFALAGKVARGGLIEVPMGITLRQIVQDIGGGIAGGKALKAVQVGGPSGGCVPAELCDTPVDYEALTGVGAIMGSGGLVVLDETDCMVDIARYFLEFTQDQSCGKCTFCRIGTRRMLEIMNRLCEGNGRKSDLQELRELGETIKAGSLCGLGKTAPNPVLSTLKYFLSEYEAHLEKRCPAGKCKALIRYEVTDKCIGCTLCAQHCPVEGAIICRPLERHEIVDDKCIRCDTCRQVCPEKAIETTTPVQPTGGGK